MEYFVQFFDIVQIKADWFIKSNQSVKLIVLNPTLPSLSGDKRRSRGSALRPHPQRVDWQRSPPAFYGVGCESLSLSMVSFLCPQNPGFPGGGRPATLGERWQGLWRRPPLVLGAVGGCGSEQRVPRAGLGLPSKPCHWTRVGIRGSKPSSDLGNRGLVWG